MSSELQGSTAGGSQARRAISSPKTSPLPHNASFRQTQYNCSRAFRTASYDYNVNPEFEAADTPIYKQIQSFYQSPFHSLTMPPAKSARNGQDDPKTETPTPKEKNGHHSAVHQSNGKLRRVASSTGSNLREVTSASAVNTTPSAQTPATGAASAPDTNTNNPGVREPPNTLLPIARLANNSSFPTLQLQWPAFERDVLHAYRRAYRLNTPTAFASDYHQWVLTQRGSVGLYSPTIARRKEYRRQNRDQLTGTVRKHFNGLGVVENDIIVDFLHKVRNQAIFKGRATRRADYTEQ